MATLAQVKREHEAAQKAYAKAEEKAQALHRAIGEGLSAGAFSAIEAAEALGVSRQRVYQMARAAGSGSGERS